MSKFEKCFFFFALPIMTNEEEDEESEQGVSVGRGLGGYVDVRVIIINYV
jgi:hypothetical protein